MLLGPEPIPIVAKPLSHEMRLGDVAVASKLGIARSHACSF
jgi:hypothetical protein